MALTRNNLSKMFGEFIRLEDSEIVLCSGEIFFSKLARSFYTKNAILESLICFYF